MLDEAYPRVSLDLYGYLGRVPWSKCARERTCGGAVPHNAAAQKINTPAASNPSRPRHNTRPHTQATSQRCLRPRRIHKPPPTPAPVLLVPQLLRTSRRPGSAVRVRQHQPGLSLFCACLTPLKDRAGLQPWCVTFRAGHAPTVARRYTIPVHERGNMCGRGVARASRMVDACARRGVACCVAPRSGRILFNDAIMRGLLTRCLHPVTTHTTRAAAARKCQLCASRTRQKKWLLAR